MRLSFHGRWMEDQSQLQTGFLAKNQLPSISPDPIVIPNLAQTCKREQSDRLLCPIRTLKFYLKMTSSYHQKRTRLFLPIKGNQDISKSSVSRWISYTFKLAYRKHTNRDISFLKIKAHEVRAQSSSWAFFDKVPLPSWVAQLDAPSDWRPGGRGFNPRRGWQHSFVEIDHEIFSRVILSLPLIQEGQLSVSGKRMCTILVNRLED